MDTQLQVGAQARAAARVREAVPTVEDAMTELTRAVGAAGSGFRGAAAGALSAALEEWQLAAVGLVPALHGYAARLVAVDTSASDAEDRQRAIHERIALRLGGGPQ